MLSMFFKHLLNHADVCLSCVWAEASFWLHHNDGFVWVYITASSMYFHDISFFFLSFLADCVEGEEPQHLREKEGEEEGEEEGRGWVADSAWYVFVCNRQVIASLLTGLPSGGVNRGGRESGEWEVQLVGWKVRGFRRGERSKVSPGSPCRCLVPVVHSCSSSSLSAGCIGARWCLQRENGTTGHRWMLWALAAEQSVAPFLLKFSKLSKRRATAER